MTIALLPVRSLRDGKRRLQVTHSSEERTILVQELLQRAVDALGNSGAITQILVVSPDQELLGRVARFGVDSLPQPGQGLNEGLEYARQMVRQRWQGAPLIVVLPDLPMIAAADIDAIISLSAQTTVVVAPDRHGVGTNAIWLPSSAAVPFQFGEGSLRRHRRAAAALGLALRYYQRPGTAFDIDTVQDLELVGWSTKLPQTRP